MVGHIRDIVLHQLRIHAYEPHRQRVLHKVVLNLNRLAHNVVHFRLRARLCQLRVDQARKVPVQALIPGN